MPTQHTNLQVELRTPRLLLRGARRDDAADLFRAMRDNKVMRYWSTKPPHATAADTAEWLKENMFAWGANGITDFLVVAQTSAADGIARPTVIGTVGWTVRRPDDQEAWISFLLRRSYWGQGYAKEAVSELLKHVWQSTEMRAVRADVDPRNVASLELLRKLGFEVTGREKNSIETYIGWCDSPEAPGPCA
ncbi:hypothetical protein HWV62_36945 [Athelia sp. TMB]|nr:hypothetical protein HWV62_36945 [Athelia sp. TMB]